MTFVRLYCMGVKFLFGILWKIDRVLLGLMARCTAVRGSWAPFIRPKMKL